MVVQICNPFDNINSYLMYFVYIPPYYKSKQQFWDEFHNLYAFVHDPWLKFGDFNDVIHPSEKLGGQHVYFNDNNCLINFINSTFY